MNFNFHLYGKIETQRYPIYLGIKGLRLGKRVRIHTGLHLAPKYWDKAKQRAKGFDGAYEFNQQLSLIASLAEQILLEEKNKALRTNSFFDTQQALRLIRTKIRSASYEFSTVFENFLNERAKIISKGTREKYNTLFNLLKNFKEKISFTDVANPSFATEFTNYCIDKGLANNTILKHFDFLNKFLRWASERRFCPAMRLQSPLKPQATDAVALTIEDLKKIINFIPTSERLQKVKDLFLFQLFSGQRFSDIIGLDVRLIDFTSHTLTLFNQKTKKKNTIPLPQIAIDIAKKYPQNLPHITNQKMNQYLKELCLEAGLVDFLTQTKVSGNQVKTSIQPKWKLISTHTARRSYVTLLREAGLGLDIIARATAHASILQTDEYNKLGTDALTKLIHQGWEKVLSN